MYLRIMMKPKNIFVMILFGFCFFYYDVSSALREHLFKSLSTFSYKSPLNLATLNSLAVHDNRESQ